MAQQPEFRSDRIRVVHLDHDPRLDAAPVSHDVRSRYVERFWLGVLGPATTFFLRWAATELDRAPGGFWMDVQQTAGQLGLVSASKHRPFHRSLGRACLFGHCEALDPSMLAVRTRLPELTPNQLAKLPDHLRREHDRYLREEPAGEVEPDRVTELARTLLMLGEPMEEIDAQLARWQVDHRSRQQALYDAYQNIVA